MTKCKQQFYFKIAERKGIISFWEYFHCQSQGLVWSKAAFCSHYVFNKKWMLCKKLFEALVFGEKSHYISPRCTYSFWECCVLVTYLKLFQWLEAPKAGSLWCRSEPFCLLFCLRTYYFYSTQSLWVLYNHSWRKVSSAHMSTDTIIRLRSMIVLWHTTTQGRQKLF